MCNSLLTFSVFFRGVCVSGGGGGGRNKIHQALQGPVAGSDVGLSLRSETEIMVSLEIVSDLETESVARSQGHTYLS